MSVQQATQTNWAGFYQQPDKYLQENILVTTGLRAPCPRSRANTQYENSAIGTSIFWSAYGNANLFRAIALRS